MLGNLSELFPCAIKMYSMLVTLNDDEERKRERDSVIDSNSWLQGAMNLVY